MSWEEALINAHEQEPVSEAKQAEDLQFQKSMTSWFAMPDFKESGRRAAEQQPPYEWMTQTFKNTDITKLDDLSTNIDDRRGEPYVDNVSQYMNARDTYLFARQTDAPKEILDKLYQETMDFYRPAYKDKVESDTLNTEYWKRAEELYKSDPAFAKQLTESYSRQKAKK